MIATVGATAEARDRRRLRVWLLSAVAGALVAIVAVTLVRPIVAGDTRGETEQRQRQRRELAAFGEAVSPIVDAGGQVVALGLKPGISDIVNRSYPPDVLATMASGWVAELAALRDDLEQVKTPSFLATTHWLYMQSLESYVNTATALGAAAAAGDDARQTELVDLAASLGRAADGLYDRAHATFDQHQARLGPPNKE